MPVPFYSIPEPIQIEIFRKLNIYDYPKFSKCSRDSFEIDRKCRKPRTVCVNLCRIHKTTKRTFSEVVSSLFGGSLYHSVRLPTKYDIPIQLISNLVSIDYRISLTPEVCELFLKTKSTVHKLEIGSVACSPEQFNTFLDATGMKKLDCQVISPEYLKVEAISKLDDLRISCPLTDFDLESLKIPNMELSRTEITSNGINSLLQDYVSGKRKGAVTIKTSEQLDDAEMFHGILYTKPPKSERDENRFFITAYTDDVFSIWRAQRYVTIKIHV